MGEYKKAALKPCGGLSGPMSDGSQSMRRARLSGALGFLEAGGLAAQRAQVVELGATNAG